jgi:hypothetical protein
MHCFYCILTSLISQALLQAALDKEERDFTGWFSQYEFLNLPVFATRRSTATVWVMPIGGNHRNRHKCKLARSVQDCHWHTSLCSRHREKALAQAYQVGCLATAAFHAQASREASRLPSLAICSRFRCQHPWLFF